MEKALDAPSAEVRLFLLYGPDEAGSAALAKRLERAMGPDAERVDLDGSTLREDPARLADEAASFSMFGDRRWIRVNGMGEESLAAVTALLGAEVAGNPVMAIAGPLKGTSKVVRLALEHRAALAFASYQPDAREAEQIVMAAAREGGLRLSVDLARQIVELTGGNRALMSAEVEKLVLYLDAAPDRPRDATAEALDALSAGMVDADAAPLVNAVLGGDLKATSRELGRLSRAGANMGSMMRPLLTRAMMLAHIRAQFDRDGRLDAAVEAQGRAVFWKEKGQVTRQARIWDAGGIARVIQRLSQAERASRSGRNLGDVLVRQELLTIARQAARER